VEATEIYIEHRKEHRLSQDQCRAMARTARFVNSLEESKKLNRLTEPAVIISASGMASGGRILHHLKAYAPDPRNTVLFVGYQAGGTRGAAMLGGAKAVKIHGDYVPIRAEIVSLDQLSSHADYREIVNWLGHFDVSPAETFITHGEPAAADALRHRLKEELGWNCSVPEYLERRTLHSIQKPEPFRAT
jgi:metallo-beta-lactamase family protein